MIVRAHQSFFGATLRAHRLFSRLEYQKCR
jgi:hypothetical protein